MKALAAAALLVVCGCATYRHERPVVLSVVIEDGRTNVVVAMESTSVRMFLQKLSATGMRSSVRDGTYSRTVTLGKVGATGDADMIQAISEGVTEGLVSSQTGGLGLPKSTNAPPLW